MQLAPKKKNQESAAQSQSAIKSVISNGRQLKVIRGKNGEIILTGVKPGQQLLIVKNDGSSKFITIPKQLDFKKPVTQVTAALATSNFCFSSARIATASMSDSDSGQTSSARTSASHSLSTSNIFSYFFPDLAVTSTPSAEFVSSSSMPIFFPESEISKLNQVLDQGGRIGDNQSTVLDLSKDGISDACISSNNFLFLIFLKGSLCLIIFFIGSATGKEISKPSTTKNSNSCHICRRILSDAACLRNHIQSQHTVGDEPFACVCGALFATKYERVKHRKNGHDRTKK